MKNKVKSNPVISNDLMRYSKNKMAGNLAILGIVFNCLYFMFMYKQVCGIKTVYTDGATVYSYIHGASVIINLLVLLVAFLTSERIKNYDKRFSYVAFGLAAIQIIRIFIYPLTSFTKLYKKGISGTVQLTDGGTFALFIAFLCLSAACFIVAGVFGYLKATKLQKFVKDVDEGNVDLEAALKEEAAGDTLTGGEANA